MDSQTISDMLKANAMELIARGEDLIEQENTLVGKNIHSDTNHAKALYERQLTILKNEQKMFTAARNGDIKEIESNLKQRENMFAVNGNGWSYAHFAAQGNQKEILQNLHNEGWY